ncbi:MAG: sulfotransferase domain-containing protein [Pseudomonadota bacterium]
MSKVKGKNGVDNEVVQRFPNFLVVGAMKAGTTTLHRDLNSHASIFLPEHKEPNALITDEIFRESGLRRYATLFAKAGASRLAGEASTSYTMRPRHLNVPERARRLLGPDLRIIYLVRNPIDRIVSHHYHAYGLGMAGPDPNDEVLVRPEYVDYSRYAWQIQPWIEVFGRRKVGIWRFEDYINDRDKTLNEIADFLGITNDQGYCWSTSAALNVSSDKAISSPVWRKFVLEAPWYSHFLKPLLSPRLRQQLARMLLGKAPPRPPALTDEVRAKLEDLLQEDRMALATMMGLSKDPWNQKSE